MSFKVKTQEINSKDSRTNYICIMSHKHQPPSADWCLDENAVKEADVQFIQLSCCNIFTAVLLLTVLGKRKYSLLIVLPILLYILLNVC